MPSVLITGASKGIGRAVAIELANRGHRVIATARRPETLADLPVDQRLRLDVTDQDSVDRAIANAGEIDVLVSNAGATVRAPLESVPLAEVEWLYQLNALGALRVAQGVLPAMRRRGAGRLVFVSSIQGRLVLPIIGSYGASKWALEAIAEGLAIGEHRATRCGVHERRRAGQSVLRGERSLPPAVSTAWRPPRRGHHHRGGGRRRGRHDRAGRASAARACGRPRRTGPEGPQGGTREHAVHAGRARLVAVGSGREVDLRHRSRVAGATFGR
jgi:hypothetical protein